MSAAQNLSASATVSWRNDLYADPEAGNMIRPPYWEGLGTTSFITELQKEIADPFHVSKWEFQKKP